MGQRKLVLFTSGDPRENPRHAWTAYHWGLTAASAGLEAEVRLAGDAVLILTENGIPAGRQGASLLEMMEKARVSNLMVSGCPNSLSSRQVSDEQVQEWNVVRRPLTEVLTEAADGSSEVIYLG